jgi:hypothetical protein
MAHSRQHEQIKRQNNARPLSLRLQKVLLLRTSKVRRSGRSEISSPVKETLELHGKLDAAILPRDASQQPQLKEV